MKKNVIKEVNLSEFNNLRTAIAGLKDGERVVIKHNGNSVVMGRPTPHEDCVVCQDRLKNKGELDG